MPTFSYAQAAKGVSDAPVTAKSVSTEPETIDSKPQEQTNDVPAESAPANPEPETTQETEKATPTVDQDAEFTTVTSKTKSKAAHSRTSSPSVKSTTTQPKEGDSSNTPNGTQDSSSEKQNQNQTDTKAEKTDKAENSTEESKEKSGKSEKTEKAEKAEKNTPPKELKAAPLPSVNIWQQRKEAQDLKAKTSPVPTSTKPAKTTDENHQDSAKSNSKKKGGDGAQEGGKGSKKSDGAKGRDAAVPSVEDASLWPTPEVAIGEEKKKAQEKTDKTEKTEKSPVNRSHGKEKWMPVSYVPTAVFNTPLPSAGRGGGRRPARGGRDGGRGGAHGGAGEKATSGQATPASGGKHAGDRGRNEAGTNRAASLPAQPRRSNSADVNNAEGRKAQGAERNNRGPRTEEAAASNGKQTNGSDNNTRPQRDGKQFNKNNDSRNGKTGHLAVDAQAAARTNDRRFESGSKSADLNREGGAGGFQDFHRERGDSRPERGGRPNRGRGGPFSGFSGQNAHFGNAGNNFVPKNFNNFNDRQRSQHGLTNGSQQGNRMPLRSPSLPASANVYGGYPFPAEINTMYSYQAVNPGPMSAVPYQQYVEPFPLMSMLSMQLEYYFSVDNMCKDMFLRRQMDSQGFVALNVIASFKRVKSLTEDFELLRHVSRQLRYVEYQTGEDGIDRLRPRERWAQWVLPYDQRDTAAQHEGVRPAQLAKNDENVPFNNHVDAPTNGSLHPVSRQFIPNGTSANNSQTLSSAAPEFLPSAQNEISNVGAPKDYFSSHTAGLGLTSPFYDPNSLENANIDESQSARGLDSHKPTPFPSPPVTAAPLNGFDERKIYRSVQRFARSTDKPSPRNSRLPSETKEKSHYFKKRPASLTNQSDISRINAPGSPDPRIRTAGDDPPVGFASYQICYQALMETFNLQMYNDFRRSALDDLFTRHIENGFNVLMEYYRASVVRPHRRLPDEVLSDMINLCRIDHLKPRALIFDMIRLSMRNHQIDHCNFSRVRRAFEESFGQEWRNPPRHTRY
ncbi:hypothetical protein N7456_002195 [Penicillium angulare]|uniref:HTH La-type RNA-binding domain-containing protein n=1 Tax=Penicillium angulare TaxID=116970 RepID=A0A9W9G7U4_9EURO|nr:hypothetical protein N7456_002195 [Penicillium angulare]